MIFEIKAERRLAFRRAGLIAVLAGAWTGYAYRLPLASRTAVLKAALEKRIAGKPGTASVSWLGEGVPLAPQELVRRAREVAVKANSKSRDLGADTAGRRSGDDDPAVVVPMMIGDLRSSDSSRRAYAAMTMCDNRFAKWKRAGEAVPGLEGVAASNDPEGAEFAELALKRIRFWAAKRGG